MHRGDGLALRALVGQLSLVNDVAREGPELRSIVDLASSQPTLIG